MKQINYRGIGGILLLGALFFQFLGSCSKESKYPEELIEIDSLLQKVQSYEDSILALDTASIYAQVAHSKENLSIINLYYKDTLDRATYKLLSDYEQIIKRSKKFYKNRQAFLSRLRDSKTNLERLKSDLEKNLVSEKEAKKQGMTKKELVHYYIDKEKNFIQGYLLKIDKHLGHLVNTQKINLKAEPEVQEMVDKLKLENNL